MSQTKPHPWRHPPPKSVPWRVYLAGLPCGENLNPRESPAKLRRQGQAPRSGGRAGWLRFDISHQWVERNAPNSEWRWSVMCCSFYVYMSLIYGSPLKQGKLWRVYIVERGYIRDPASPISLSWLPHVLQATSPWGYRKSTTATHVEQWVLCSSPAQINCCT